MEKKKKQRSKGDRMGWRRVGVLERKTLKQVLGGVDMVPAEMIFEERRVKVLRT